MGHVKQQATRLQLLAQGSVWGARGGRKEFTPVEILKGEVSYCVPKEIFKTHCQEKCCLSALSSHRYRNEIKSWKEARDSISFKGCMHAEPPTAYSINVINVCECSHSAYNLFPEEMQN